MIWDRFDDAHDDLLKDINKGRGEVDELKAKLKKAGIPFKPYEEPKSGGQPEPQGWYEDNSRRLGRTAPGSLFPPLKLI